MKPGRASSTSRGGRCRCSTRGIQEEHLQHPGGGRSLRREPHGPSVRVRSREPAEFLDGVCCPAPWSRTDPRPHGLHRACATTEGGTLDDLALYRLGEERFLLVVNAARVPGPTSPGSWRRAAVRLLFAWRTGPGDQAMIAVQGPKAEGLVSSVIDDVPAAASGSSASPWPRGGSDRLAGQPQRLHRGGRFRDHLSGLPTARPALVGAGRGRRRTGGAGGPGLPSAGGRFLSLRERAERGHQPSRSRSGVDPRSRQAAGLPGPGAAAEPSAGPAFDRRLIGLGPGGAGHSPDPARRCGPKAWRSAVVTSGTHSPVLHRGIAMGIRRQGPRRRRQAAGARRSAGRPFSRRGRLPALRALPCTAETSPPQEEELR